MNGKRAPRPAPRVEEPRKQIEKQNYNLLFSTRIRCMDRSVLLTLSFIMAVVFLGIAG
jgi:hypothetical protein